MYLHAMTQHSTTSLNFTEEIPHIDQKLTELQVCQALLVLALQTTRSKGIGLWTQVCFGQSKAVWGGILFFSLYKTDLYSFSYEIMKYSLGKASKVSRKRLTNYWKCTSQKDLPICLSGKGDEFS